MGLNPLNLDVTVNGILSHVTVSQIEQIQTIMTINKNTVLTVTTSGDIETTVTKTIVFGENASITITPREYYLEGVAAIPYKVENKGILATRFNATFTVNGETFVKQVYLPAGASLSDTLTLNLTCGRYLLMYSTPFQEGNATIHVETASEFIVTSLPENKTFRLGQWANMTVTLKNIGRLEGEARVSLIVPGITEETSRTWIKPNEEGNVTFTFHVPDDLEEKYYKAIFEVDEKDYEVRFFVEGAKIAVNATLDKCLYSEGENATLTLAVENLRDMNLTLFARVKLADYDAIRYFNLTGYEAQALTFSVPAVFDAGKMLYSVYMDSGRALYINALYIYQRQPDSAGITLYTDKQVYEIGETVIVYVNTTKTGRLVMKAPNLDVNTTVSTGLNTFTFTVPKLRSGTILIEYAFEGYSSAYPIDVIGYSGRVIDSALDKSSYLDGDMLNLTLLIEVNRDFEGLVKIWVFDPENNVIGEASLNHTFTIGENSVHTSVLLDTNRTGLHAVVFRVYAYGSFIWLASGTRYFDVTFVDASPPQITHIPVTNGIEGQAIGIYALVTDDVGVQEVTLYYRRLGEQSYTKTPMLACQGCIDTYNASIPASAVTTATIDYYIVASDGTNNETDGTPANPHVISINLYPAAIVLNDPTEVTDSSLKLTWTASVDSDFKNYTIYRSTTQGSLGTPLQAMITDRQATSYTVSGLSPDTTYYFTVRVYDSGGLYSGSNQVSAKTAASPFLWLIVVGLVVVGAAVVLLLNLRRRSSGFQKAPSSLYGAKPTRGSRGALPEPA